MWSVDNGNAGRSRCDFGLYAMKDKLAEIVEFPKRLSRREYPSEVSRCWRDVALHDFYAISGDICGSYHF